MSEMITLNSSDVQESRFRIVANDTRRNVSIEVDVDCWNKVRSCLGNSFTAVIFYDSIWRVSYDKLV